MHISTEDFLLEEIRYQGFVRALPAKLRGICPMFHDFISPVDWHNLDRGAALYRAYNRGEYIELSITAAQHWAMMKSPYAATLIRIYALQRLNKEPVHASESNQHRSKHG